MSDVLARLERVPFSRPHLRLLAMGGLGITFDGLDVAILAFALPSVAEEWQLSGFQTGLVPLYVVILLSTLAGVLLSTILGLRSRISTSLRIRKQDKQIAELEQKLAARSRSLVLDVPDAPAGTTSEPQTTPRV